MLNMSVATARVLTHVRHVVNPANALSSVVGEWIKVYVGYSFVEAQVPERGVEDRYLLDDFCMGIELTVIVCWHAGRPTLHQWTISG